MQLQSTFGAFLVAFTMVHGAPMIAQAHQNPALWGIEQDAGLKPADNLPIVDKHNKPSLDNLGALGMSRAIARDVKKSSPPKGKSNELAKAKGAEAGKKTVAGLKSILDDKLDKDSKEEKDPKDDKITEPCNRDGKKDEDKEKDDKDDDDAEKSGDDDGKDDKEKDKDEKEKDKRGLRNRSAPVRRAPPKSNKGSSPGKDSSSGKPPGGQQDGGSSIGKDIFTQTTSNVISDGILYGVDQALSEEDQPAKRALLKSGSPNTPGRQQKRFGGGDSAVGVGKLRQMSSQVVKEPWAVPYSDISEDATTAAAPEKRSRRTRGGRYRFNKSKSSPGSPSPGQLKDVDVPLPTTELYGVDQVINPDEAPAAAQDGAAAAAPVKRSPWGGSSRQKPGPGNGPQDLNRRPGFDIPPPSPADILSGIDIDEAIAGQGAGPQQDTTPPPPVKRSPRGGKFRGVGKDVATDVVSDGISTGFWYGVDEATTANSEVEKRIIAPGPTVGDDGNIVDGGVIKLPEMNSPECRGKPGLCAWAGTQQPGDDLMAEDSDVKLAVEPDLAVVGGSTMQKRQKGKGNKGKGPSTSPSSSGGSKTPSSGGSTSNPASSPTKTEPKTQPQTQPQSQPKTEPKTDSNPAPAQAPAQAPASGGGFVQGTKDAAIDIGTGAATGIIVAGVEQAIAPAQPTETVVVEAPAAEAAAPVAGEEAAAAAPVPAEAPAPVRRRAVRFAA